MKNPKGWLITICLVLGLAVASFGAAYGLSMFTKSVGAIGSMDYTNQCQIDEIKVLTLDKVKLVVKPTAQTVADRQYIAHLYTGTSDDNLTEVATYICFSWTHPQITAGTPKVHIFTGLNLAPITKIHVELTH